MYHSNTVPRTRKHYPENRSNRSEEHKSELQSLRHLVCRLLLEKKNIRQPMAHLKEINALYAFLVAAAVTALLTPLTMRVARAVGAVDEPRERGLSARATP